MHYWGGKVFRLTTHTFNTLKTTSMGDLVSKLAPLENRIFTSKKDFLHAVNMHIGEEHTHSHRQLLVLYADVKRMFEREIGNFQQRYTEKTSRCPLCRSLRGGENYDPSDQFSSEKVYGSLERVPIDGAGSGCTYEYLLRCPRCGTYYRHRIHERDANCDVEPMVFWREHFYQLPDPMFLSETYVHSIHQEFPAITFRGITINPKKLYCLTVEISSVADEEQAAALRVFAEEWARYLDDYVRPLLDPKIIIQVEDAPQIGHEEGIEPPSHQTTYLLDRKEIECLLYGGDSQQICLKDPHHGTITITSTAITAIHIQPDAERSWHIVIETANGNTYSGTIQQEVETQR